MAHLVMSSFLVSRRTPFIHGVMREIKCLQGTSWTDWPRFDPTSRNAQVHDQYEELSRKISEEGPGRAHDFQQKPKMWVLLSVRAARLRKTYDFTGDVLQHTAAERHITELSMCCRCEARWRNLKSRQERCLCSRATLSKIVP